MSDVFRHQPFPFLPDVSLEREFKQRWLVRFRLCAALVQTLCMLLAFQFGYLNAQQLGLSILLLSLVLAFNLYSLLGKWILAQLDNAYFFAQQVFDLLAIGSLLAVTGGWRTPFVAVLFLHGTLAAMMIEQALSRLFLGLLLLVLAAQVHPLQSWSESATWLTWYLPMASLLCLNFLMVASLANYLRRNREVAAQLSLAKLQMDRLHGLGALTAGLCHELRTPLNTVGMHLDRVNRRGSSEDLTAAQEALDHCQLVLGRLFDSKADPSHFGFTELPWCAMIEDVVNEWRAGHKDIEVLIERELKSEVLISLPRTPIVNCLCDLLDNAAEAMDHSGAISLWIQSDETGVRLLLEDQGCGWPDSVLTHLGEPFISTKPHGVGLGLYNALQLIGGLGGSMVLQAGIKGGAAVAIAIPRRPKEPVR